MNGEAIAPRFTERLRLVPIRVEHADELLRLHTDPAVVDYWGPWTQDQATERAAAFEEGWKTRGVSKWLAYERTTGALVGRGGLSYATVDGAERLELGWSLAGEHRGRGFASEVGAAGLAFAFDELAAPEVVAFTETDNRPSRAVMERLGMIYQRDILHLDEDFALYRTRASGRARRPSARVVLVGPHDRVLLVRMEDDGALVRADGTAPPPTFWITPGGAVEPGEALDEAVRREVAEETGITDVVLGPLLFTRYVELALHGQPLLAIDHLFAGWTNTTDTQLTGLLPEERGVLVEHRWWSLAEIVDLSRSKMLIPPVVSSLVKRALSLPRPR